MSSHTAPECITSQTRNVLFQSEAFSFIDFRCRAHVESEGPEEPNATHSIVFVRRGVFQRTQHREVLTADPNHVLFFNALQPYRYAHPLPGGDECTILAVATDAAVNLVARQSPWDAEDMVKPFRIPLVIEDAVVELAEEAMRLAYTSYGRPRKEVNNSVMAAATVRKHRDLTEATKLALNQSLETLPSLDDLARNLACSPFHLSRVFHQTAGMSLRRYITRLRAGVAADRLATGASNLTELALDLGFTDHSHFTNTFRREWGLSPSNFRARFSAS
jgi:AraC-like DNA-binding protein